MNLLGLDSAQRAPFSRLTAGLVQQKAIPATEIFLNVLESQEATEMNYWMAKVLIEDHAVSPQLVVGEDATGEKVKALQAACLLNNSGVVAAILESHGFQGAIEGREFQLAARIASQQEDEVVMGLIMKYAQQMGHLETLMRSLQGSKLN